MHDLPSQEPFTFKPTDRILVMAPHPDDETLACGGILAEAKRRGLPAKVVFLTYGDHNEWSFITYSKHPVLEPSALRHMGEIRRGEAINADRILGLSSKDLVFLGYPDAGTLAIWRAHWGSAPPLNSRIIAARSVAYPDAFRPKEAFKGENILNDIETVVKAFKPTIVCLPNPADANSDHQACYLFTRVALWNLSTSLNATVLTYLVHVKGWPRPRGFSPNTPLHPPESKLSDEAVCYQYQLLPEQITLKHRAIEKHRTQMSYASRFLLSFIRPNELFFEENILRATLAASSISPPSHHSPHTMDHRISLESVTLNKANQCIRFIFHLRAPLKMTESVTLYLFGYRPDMSFSDMPKLHLTVSSRNVKLRDQSRSLSTRKISVQREKHRLAISVPLAELKEPSRLIMGWRLGYTQYPDHLTWQIVDGVL